MKRGSDWWLELPLSERAKFVAAFVAWIALGLGALGIFGALALDSPGALAFFLGFEIAVIVIGLKLGDW